MQQFSANNINTESIYFQWTFSIFASFLISYCNLTWNYSLFTYLNSVNLARAFESSSLGYARDSNFRFAGRTYKYNFLSSGFFVFFFVVMYIPDSTCLTFWFMSAHLLTFTLVPIQHLVTVRLSSTLHCMHIAIMMLWYYTKYNSYRLGLTQYI